MQSKKLQEIFRKLNRELRKLHFAEPVTHVYNPLLYAQESARIYAENYLCGPAGRTLLLGMNPGPWGMAQTGVPFGEIAAVRDWLEISAPVATPPKVHPKRPIQGFECTRSEVSGRRLWGLFRENFAKASDFAQRFLVFNYCPLIFLEASGRNRTPDKLPKKERETLFAICDESLVKLLNLLQVNRAFGVGQFALKRLKSVQADVPALSDVASVLHPSPASPKANRGWAPQVAPVLGLHTKEALL